MNSVHFSLQIFVPVPEIGNVRLHTCLGHSHFVDQTGQVLQGLGIIVDTLVERPILNLLRTQDQPAPEYGQGTDYCVHKGVADKIPGSLLLSGD